MRTSSRRPVTVAYAVLAYASFLAAVLWAVAFLADLTGSQTVDGGSRRPAWAALLVDAGLLLIFAGQHSVMARAGFKRRLTRVLPAAAERSTYVLTASVALFLVFWLWQPVPAIVWRVSAEPWVALIWAVFAVGWLITVAATFMIDHWDLVGLRQAGWRPGAEQYQPPPFRERWLYGWMRHPMMSGLLLTFWATPRMTAGHLFFAVAASGYIVVGLRFEVQDLRQQLGDAYREYETRVPALLPRRPRACPVPRAGRPLREPSSK